MQLQKRFNRKVGDKEYSKWQVVIPPEKIDELGWREGEELLEEVRGYKLTLIPKNKAKNNDQTVSSVRQPQSFTRTKRVKKLGRNEAS